MDAELLGIGAAVLAILFRDQFQQLFAERGAAVEGGLQDFVALGGDRGIFGRRLGVERYGGQEQGRKQQRERHDPVPAYRFAHRQPPVVIS
ncbi:hypothetical protein [Sphingopyxis sp. PET50]|uniref:hypothetical protein n=1 Tax=Sphingopyxis sp. PET50 TaxID=2976533 RepID=UPI0021AFEDB2|nr:hypothetical protein [Sphingopyxis sp. PET50]